MKPRPVAACVFALALLGALTAHARWLGPADNKSMVELEGMTDQELGNEAFAVCVRRALVEGPLDDFGAPTNPPPPGAADYLSSIAGVVANRNGGKVPRWMDALTEAHTVKRCQRGYRTFLQSTAPKKPRARKTTRRRGTIQLPPWLAPR